MDPRQWLTARCSTGTSSTPESGIYTHWDRIRLSAGSSVPPPYSRSCRQTMVHDTYTVNMASDITSALQIMGGSREKTLSLSRPWRDWSRDSGTTAVDCRSSR
jgi:hypothetical protein